MTPCRPVDRGGTGDAFSALFLGHYLTTGDLRLALERAVAAIFALVATTHAGCAPAACASWGTSIHLLISNRLLH